MLSFFLFFNDESLDLNHLSFFRSSFVAILIFQFVQMVCYCMLIPSLRTQEYFNELVSIDYLIFFYTTVKTLIKKNIYSIENILN